VKGTLLVKDNLRRLSIGVTAGLQVKRPASVNVITLTRINI